MSLLPPLYQAESATVVHAAHKDPNQGGESGMRNIWVYCLYYQLSLWQSYLLWISGWSNTFFIYLYIHIVHNTLLFPPHGTCLFTANQQTRSMAKNYTQQWEQKKSFSTVLIDAVDDTLLFTQMQLSFVRMLIGLLKFISVLQVPYFSVPHLATLWVHKCLYH